ncbi:hypothetical protein [Pseudomonas syringae]|uniref:hypothetical protein n=1 Tax=Pseudomonas syringae TaxID=317 RepID=UPI001060FE62|nr:hypothetical protein [Pseudomonas syringae]
MKVFARSGKATFMNELSIYPIFIIISIFLYSPSLWAKYAFSGKSFSKLKFWTLMAYNIFLVYLHMGFIQENHLPFYGPQDSSSLGWLSLALIVAHASSNAVPWDEKSWLSRRR